MYFQSQNLISYYKMLNLNKEGEPYAKFMGGKYNNHIVSVSDKTDAL